MRRPTERNVLHVLLILSTATLTRCALLEMSRVLWNRTVSGGLTKVGKLDPLRVPVIKVDQSEGDTSYRIILRNLEIVGLNESTLESIHVARGALKSNLSEFETGYVSYSDLRDVDSVRYQFHTMTREPSAPREREGSEAVVSPVNHATDIRPTSRYQEGRFDRLQDQYGSRVFDQNRQYDRQIPFRSDATSDGFYRGNLRASSDDEAGNFGKRPAYVQSAYAQRGRNFRGHQGSSYTEDVDCEGTADSKLARYPKNSRQYEQRQSADNRRGGIVEVSASETVETRLKNQDGVRVPALYNREQFPQSDIVASGNFKSTDRMKEQLGFIDIVYMDDKANGSVKHFGNSGIDLKDNQRVFNVEDIMKNIRDNTRFLIYNFTDGESLRNRNDLVRAALEAKRLKDLMRYATSYQEQQGYFEEGMQLLYHYGGINVKSDGVSQNVKLNDAKRIKRAHFEEVVDDDVMHVILRIRVPLLRVKSQYTLTGKVGREILHGSGLFAGNFTEVVGDFALELKKVNDELMIVRAARAKLSAKNKKISLQGMNEKGPVQAVFNHSLMAAEAVAAMLADDFATKGLSERTADALIYRMYKDLPAN